MRILIFSLSYYPLGGGAEMAIKEITSRIPREDIQFDMVTLRFDKSHPKYERMGNVDVHRIGGGMGYLSKILFVLQAAFFANRRKYDAYWGMMTNMLFPISILRLSGIRTPYIITLQDGDPFEYVFERARIKIFKPLLNYGFRHAEKAQAISYFLAGWAKKLGYKGVIEVIPNGVDANKFDVNLTQDERNALRKEWGMTSDDVILTSSSRLVKKNGLDDVVRAIPLMPKNFKFVNFGFGPYKKMLEDLVKELKMSDRIRFLDYSEKELPRQFKACDIFIRPSLSEGQGISFLEGMAAGLPVIATPVGGIPDFLKDGETGLMVEPRSPRLIAFQAQKLVSDRVLRDKITINALRMVREKYDWDLIAKEMENGVFKAI